MDIKIFFVTGEETSYRNKSKMDYDMGHRYSIAAVGEFVVVTTPRGEKRWYRQSAIAMIDETIPVF